MVFLVLSPARAVAFILVQQGLFGLYLRRVLRPITKGMPILEATDRSGSYARQVLTSRNVRGGWLTDLALGGLNYRIEHHLFPLHAPAQPALFPGDDQGILRTAGPAYCETSLVGSYAQALRHLNTVGKSARRT